MKGYSTFPQTTKLELHHQVQCSVIPKIIVGWDYYSFEKMQSVFITAPTDGAVFVFVFLSILPDSNFWKMIGWGL